MTTTIPLGYTRGKSGNVVTSKVPVYEDYSIYKQWSPEKGLFYKASPEKATQSLKRLNTKKGQCNNYWILFKSRGKKRCLQP